jgi:hypothetical protein
LFSSVLHTGLVGKNKGDPVFGQLDTTKLNAHLKDLMPGLTAKVFRTYNASITLDAIVSSTQIWFINDTHSSLSGLIFHVPKNEYFQTYL